MKNEDMIEILEACQERRIARRAFLRGAGSVAAVAGVTGLAGCGDSTEPAPAPAPTPPPTGPAPTPTPPPTGGPSDAAILNFALNLEYLEAQFYSFAAFGTGLPADLLSGTGTQGAVTGGRQASLSNRIALYAREIAIDERDHVRFLRQALGNAAVAQPAIDVSSGPDSAFSAAARAAGLIGAGQSFDPYANDANFLLGAFIFEDVGVTAYKGASPLIDSKVFLEAAAGILAAEAYHAGLIRTEIYAMGVQMPSLRDATIGISNARDALDNPEDVDQPVVLVGNRSNIVPTDGRGIAFSRTPGDVLNIVYLTAEAAQQGGFFPNGVNGEIRMSTAG